jgi:glycosyltransferase involved in cell wall biosynthesis
MSGDPGSARVVIAHEWITVPGGSEKVVQAMCRVFPSARIVAAVVDPETAAALFPGHEVQALWTDRLPAARSRWPYYAPAIVAAWTAHRVRDADLLVTSSHFATKGAGLRFRGPHLSYVYTPMRMAWRPDLERLRLPRALAPLGRLAVPALRRWDRRVARTPTELVADSTVVRERIRSAYGRDAAVVFPPVDLEPFRAVVRRPGAAFLAFGRLVTYKRFDLAVAACTRLGLPLVVAGAGPEEPRLRAMAGPTVTFLGRVDDDEYRRLLGSARALLFPGEEDFGIVPVEAQAAGCPVIAFGRGGVLDSVDAAHGNALFDEQTVEALAAALARFPDRDDPAQEAARRASTERFSMAAFELGFRAAVLRVLDGHGA